jgi:hypothetical protein
MLPTMASDIVLSRLPSGDKPSPDILSYPVGKCYGKRYTGKHGFVG